MSAFNTVRGEAICPLCGTPGVFEVQFKYGNTWQMEYNLGEQLRWGGNDVGTRGAKKVVVEGISNKCSSCGRDMLEFDVVIEGNILKRLVGVGESRKMESEFGYRIVDE